MERPDTNTVPIIIAWCGRIRAYSGADIIGMKLIRDALQREPDLKDAMKALKLIKQIAPMKEEATNLFKEENFEEAIAKFDECLLIDPLNITFNATILLNKSIAQTKLGQTEPALSSLNRCLKFNPEYAKALVKRGEIYQQLEDYEEAVNDFGAAKILDPTGFGVEQKLLKAQDLAKKNKIKDYYKILGVSKNANDSDIKKAYMRMARDWHPDRHS